MSAPHHRVIGLALLLVLSVQVAVFVQLRGPRPKPTDAPLDAFSATRAFAVLQRLLGDQAPHPTGSDANTRVRERLVKEMEQLGLDVEVQQFARGPDPRRTLYNVLARLPNTSSAVQPLVLATHYDSVPAGPGAADAGSCVAALLETARALQRGGPYKRPIYLLITDGEEAGLLGASAFVGVHELSQEKPFVLNFEARGASGPSIMFETHRGNLATARLLARSLPRPSVTGSSFVTVYRLLPNDTDFTVFQRAGWTGMNFSFIGDAHRYHTPQDNLENLSLRSLQHHGENALTLARLIAESEQIDLEPSAEDAVFFDVLGLQVVAFPQSWLGPLVALPVLLLLLRFGTQFASRSTWFGVAMVAVAVVLVFIAAALLGTAVTWLLSAAGLLSRKYVPYGGWLTAFYVLLSLTLVWCLARPLLRRVSSATIWIVLWLSWSLVGVAIGFILPGFSYFTLVPALGAAVLAILPANAVRARIFGTILVASVVLLPLANLLPIALGARAGVAVLPVWTLVWLPLLPLLGTTEKGADEGGADASALDSTPASQEA